MFYDIFHFAVQYVTQRIDRFRTDITAVLYAVNRVGREPLFKDQLIFGYSFFQKRLIKGRVTYQIQSPTAV